jgi:hypothetical protein
MYIGDAVYTKPGTESVRFLPSASTAQQQTRPERERCVRLLRR